MSAIVDFTINKRGKWIVKKSNASGMLLGNGNFIFHLDLNMERNLVLTTNQGNIIKSGYLELPADDWLNSSKWLEPSNLNIKNFKGFEGNIKTLSFR